MKGYKFLQGHKVIFLLISLTIPSQSCNVDPSGNFNNNGNDNNLSLATFPFSLLTAIGNSFGSESNEVNHGDPTPVTVNPNLERLDERYSKCRGIDIREISVLGIQKLYLTNRLTTVELTKCYLERLDKMNNFLRVVIEINPDALNEAVRLDIERKSGIRYGSMHGIPVLLKDSIGTIDLTETTLGSPALVGIRPKREADVVIALRKAGALILGKSHCQEMYGFRDPNIPHGWSGRGGQSRNAYNLSVTPQGSSSGSAVGVAANLVPVAVGSETDGSILVPASLSGIVGMKPTLGLPSTKGAIPLSSNQDHLGPMARTVQDVAALLDAMVPESERPSHHPASYAYSVLENKFARPFRVGVLRFPFWDLAVIDSINLRHQLPQLERIVQGMKSSEVFEVIDPAVPSHRNISTSKMFTVLYHDFKHEFNGYLKHGVVDHYSIPHSPNPYPHSPESHIPSIAPSRRIDSLADLIKYNEEHPTPEGYTQQYLVTSQATDGIHNETYIQARDTNRVAAREFLDSVFDRYNLDAIMTPNEYRIERISMDSFQDFPVFGYTVACIAGYPTINIPAGIGLREVPFGMMFIAKPYDEPTLLHVALAAEKLNPQRRTPKFLI